MPIKAATHHATTPAHSNRWRESTKYRVECMCVSDWFAKTTAANSCTKTCSVSRSYKTWWGAYWTEIKKQRRDLQIAYVLERRHSPVSSDLAPRKSSMLKNKKYFYAIRGRSILRPPTPVPDTPFPDRTIKVWWATGALSQQRGRGQSTFTWI